MKTLIALVCLLGLLVVTRPAVAQEDCPNCVKVRVALALAQAHTDTVATKPTPEPTAPAPAPTVTAPQPVRIYRMGSLPPNWVAPAPVVLPYYQIQPPVYCAPGQ